MQAQEGKLLEQLLDDLLLRGVCKQSETQQRAYVQKSMEQ